MSVDKEYNIKQKLLDAFNLISSVNKEAYKDKFLVSNQVLTKHPYNNNFLNRFLNNEQPKKYGPIQVFSKICWYYIKNFLHLAIFFIRFFEYALSFYRFNPSKGFNEIIIVDTCFLTEKIKEANGYYDRYFLGLEDVLKNMGKHYVFLPIFYSPYHNRLPLELRGVLKVLKKNKIPAIIEYQLLSPGGFASLLYFIITYPVHVLKLVKNLPVVLPGMGLLKDELIATLDQVVFYNFWRYLQGKKLARLPYNKIKVISWYENQSIHKNLYMGLKEVRPEIEIYGGKLCLYSKNFISELPDENEAGFGIVPDKIIVNGAYYFPQNSQFNYAVGPSLRYKMIFDAKLNKEDQKHILILLPFFPDDIRNILSMFFNSGRTSKSIVIKVHPISKIADYRDLIPSDAKITTDDVYKVFETSKIVIGAASGVLLEAASLGIPVVLIKNNKCFDYNNPLPEYGRGILWEEASTPQELCRQIDKFERALCEDPTEINTIADEYKNLFFHEITQGNIIKAFDL